MNTPNSKYRLSSAKVLLACSISLLTACGGESLTPSATGADLNTSGATQTYTSASSTGANYSGIQSKDTSRSNTAATGATATESAAEETNAISSNAGTLATTHNGATVSETTVESAAESTTAEKSKPVVSLSLSESGSSFAKGTVLTIKTTATDKDGKIKQVSLYENGNWINKATAAPYSFTWSSDTVGTYYLYAKATDNDGYTTQSATTTINIIEDKNSNEKPSVSVTSPGNGTSFNEGTTINLSAKATDTDGTITKVAFYADGVWLGKVESAPYAFTWSGAKAGVHEIYAVATDDDIGMTTSATVRLTVNSAPKLIEPTVTVTSPTDVSSVQEGTQVVIQANAADSDGTIKKVEFYDNGGLIGSDSTAPYSFSWDNALAGSHDIYAVATDNDNLKAESDTVRLTVNKNTSGSLVTYPVNGDINALFKSAKFGVKVSQNGSSAQESFVYQDENTADPNWDGTFDYMQEKNHWTTLSFSGSVTVEARRLDGQSVKTCVVRPQALKISPTIQGSKCTFTLSKPAQISVEIDESYAITQSISGIGSITKKIVKNPLFVFAEPLEDSPPKAGDANVVYFGPGIHEIGKQYKVPNNTTVYLAGGSYVIGTFVTGSDPTNIEIRGRGILSGKGLTESSSENSAWGNHAIDFSDGNKGSGLLIEGITIVDPLRSCIVAYNTVDIRNIKLFSWDHRNDGIVAGNDSIIEDSFIKVQDDNIKLYYSNQTIRNIVVWQQTAGAVFKLAWDLKRVSENNMVTNIDIIHSDVFTDYTDAEPDRSDMQSTSAVFSSMGFQNGAASKDNTFKWIRIEEENLLRLMSLRLVSTHEGPSSTDVWGDPDPKASKKIQNIVIDDIKLGGVPWKQSTLYGNSGGTIDKVSFYNMKIKDQQITSKGAFTSRLDGVGFLTAGNVTNLTISE